MTTLFTYGIPAGIILLVLLTLGLMFSRLYKKASKKRSFVRTGLGGEKVIMNGGALIFKVIHEVMDVNMETLKISVIRSKTDSLITKNRMRVDISVEFYVRVQQTAEAISKAAQTLGDKTLNPDRLRPLIEGKFVDALRSVAAKMDMDNLHEQRKEFIEEVQKAVFEDLLKNGLELESVSLVDFNQTSLEYFNEENAFDAQGLTLLTERIEGSKERRNSIAKDNQIKIEERDLLATQESLRIAKDAAFATAKQNSEVAEEESIRKRESEEAIINSERSIQEARIQKDRSIEEKEIEKAKTLDTRRIEKEKSISLAEQEKSIEISKKSEEESQSKAKANEQKALEVQSSEKIITAREEEEANRNKSITIIKAEEDAERESIGKKVSAKAELEASTDLAEAAKIVAQGKADSITIEATANEKKFSVDAAGASLLNEAENKLSPEIIQLRLKTTLIENMSGIVSEVVRPMENIDSIKIIDMGGAKDSPLLGGVANSGTSASDNLVNSALKYQMNTPLVKNLLSEINLDTTSVAGLTQPLESILGTNESTASAIVADSIEDSVEEVAETSSEEVKETTKKTGKDSSEESLV